MLQDEDRHQYYFLLPGRLNSHQNSKQEALVIKKNFFILQTQLIKENSKSEDDFIAILKCI